MTQIPGQLKVSRQLNLRCRCGHVSGVARDVAPHAGLRVVCYCRYCQAFARFLDRPDVLDSCGGTDIFQMPAGRVQIVAGADAVRCLQLSRKVYRWYAECCKTPIGNTAGPRIPFVGLIHSFVGGDYAELNDALGAPLGQVNAESATAPLPPDAPPPLSRGLIALHILRVLGWWLRGFGRPNPFFDGHTGAPLSTPRLLTPEERAVLLSSV
jgi:hypothetical protein